MARVVTYRGGDDLFEAMVVAHSATQSKGAKLAVLQQCSSLLATKLTSEKKASAGITWQLQRVNEEIDRSARAALVECVPDSDVLEFCKVSTPVLSLNTQSTTPSLNDVASWQEFKQLKSRILGAEQQLPAESLKIVVRAPPEEESKDATHAGGGGAGTAAGPGSDFRKAFGPVDAAPNDWKRRRLVESPHENAQSHSASSCQPRGHAPPDTFASEEEFGGRERGRENLNTNARDARQGGGRGGGGGGGGGPGFMSGHEKLRIDMAEKNKNGYDHMSSAVASRENLDPQSYKLSQAYPEYQSLSCR
eukprot:3607637-Rhodomonas_salina.1